MKISFFTFCFFLLCLNVFAQEGPSVEIDKIVIEESLSDETTDTSHASQSISLPATASQTKSVADVISQTAGVHIRRFGGLEEATSISIRGSSHEQVSVFLDGVPLESASGEGLGLNQLSANALSKIEIYKSLTPSELGGGAVGGVINLKSREIDQGWHQKYGFGFGSFLTFEGLAEIMHGGQNHDVILGIDFRRTQGDFSFLDNNGTPLNPNDDQKVKRQNNEHQIFHPYLKWVHRFDKRTTVSWVHHLFRADSGVPGLGSFQSKNADLSETEWLSSLQFERQGFFSEKINFKNNFYGHWIKSQFSDPNGEIGLGSAQDNDNNTMIFGDRLLWATNFSDDFIVKSGADVIFEWYLPKDYASANPIGSTSKRQQLNLMLEPHWYLLKRKILLSAQLQSMNAFYSVNNDDASLVDQGTFFSNRNDNQFAGALAVSYSPQSYLHFKSSVGRAVRLPKFIEMFGDQGVVVGNPRLTSEKSLKFDAGMIYSQKFAHWISSLYFETNYFESHVDDLIQFEVATGFARASNIGQATIRGVEVIAGTKFAKSFELTSNYTFQQAKDEAIFPGNYLVGRPVHEFNVDLGFKNTIWTVGTNLNFIDDQYLDALNTQRVDHRAILNFYASYLLKEKYRFGLEAKNLTNSQVVDAVGFPLPGRSFFGRIDVFF